MTIYSDNAGNKFLGDCIYANHNISYPNIKFLQAYPHSDISAELTNLLTASGLNFRNVLSQSAFDGGGVSDSLLTFGVDSDTINDRYNFQCASFIAGSSGGASGTLIQMYNDSGYTSTSNSFSRTNSIFGLSNNDTATITNDGRGLFYSLGFQSKVETNSEIQCVGVADNESLALWFYQYNFSDNNFRTALYYAGTVDAVNTNFNYYNANITTRSIMMCTRFSGNLFYTSAPTIYVGHRIANTAKFVLTTGDAQYPIVCSDGQNPTSQWATDFYVFDDNATLGYPAIGKVRNLLLAQGTYTIGKPVKLQGSVLPDNGFNRWIPVGTFAGKTVLMRCYSSVEI